MVIAVRTVPGSEGLEVVKEADSDQDRSRLRHEADMLRRAAHPGVVEVIDHGDGVLRLRHHGTPLGHLLPLPADHAAAVVCAVAESVEAMHDAGVAHGRITTDHVLLDDRGRPRLCGFAHAEPVVTPRSGGAADDAAALGHLLRELLDAAAGQAWSPAVEGARARTKRRRARQAFRDAAAMATRADPTQRISPRQLASALRAALPGLELPTPPAADGAAPGGGSRTKPPTPSPAESLLWSDDELTFLKTDDPGVDGRAAGTTSPHGPYAALADLNPDADNDAGDEPHDPVRQEIPGQLGLLDTSARSTTAGSGGHIDDDSATVPRATAVAGTDRAAERAEASGPAALAPVKLRDAAVPPKPPRPTTTYLLIAVALLALGGAIGILVTQILPATGGDDVETLAGDDGAPAGPDDSQGTAAETTTPDPTDPTDPAGGTEGTDGGPWPAECAVPAIAGPDIDGDGCPSEITLDGRLATVGDVEVSLGSAGDLAVVADVDCDGVSTPFLLRPSTGEVFAFPEWAIEHPVEVTTMTVIDGAVSITATPDDDGCGDVVAIQVSGQSDDTVIARHDG